MPAQAAEPQLLGKRLVEAHLGREAHARLEAEAQHRDGAEPLAAALDIQCPAITL